MDLADRLDPLYGALGLATSTLGRAVVTAQLGTIRACKRLRRSPRLRRLYLERLAPLRRVLTRSRDALSA